jgi:hypothetical protein
LGNPVILTRNIWKKAGLFNSSKGVIREVYWEIGSPIEEPDIIMVEFEDFLGKGYQGNLIPFRRTKDYSERG